MIINCRHAPAKRCGCLPFYCHFLRRRRQHARSRGRTGSVHQKCSTSSDRHHLIRCPRVWAAFQADRTFLSDSAFTERGQTSRSTGGVSNTSGLSSFAISLSGTFGDYVEVRSRAAESYLSTFEQLELSLDTLSEQASISRSMATRGRQPVACCPHHATAHY